MRNPTKTYHKHSLQQIKHKIHKKYTKSFADALSKVIDRLYEKGISPTTASIIKAATTKK